MARRPRADAPPSAENAEGDASFAASEVAERAHRLVGLEPDNFLAFLALLGLLRALDAARPAWKARAHWDLDTHPLRPVLTLREAAPPTAVAEVAAEGIAKLLKAHDLGGRKDINYSRQEARDLLSKLSADPAELYAALMSDAVLNDKGQVSPTPLCLLFGQGHQHFLDRLAGVPALRQPPARGTGRNKTPVSVTDCLSEALFETWCRLDNTQGFRWDPAEDRRYALRADDPSGDSVGLQHGANRLAAIGLPVLSGAAILRRSELRFLVRATSYTADGTIAITWPLWPHPARLSAIRALLCHPTMAEHGAVAADELHRLGIAHVMRAERISVGKFMNITVAERLS